LLLLVLIHSRLPAAAAAAVVADVTACVLPVGVPL
jgi:hypothetical protein